MMGYKEGGWWAWRVQIGETEKQNLTDAYLALLW